MGIRLAQKKDIDQIVKLCKLHAAYEKVEFIHSKKKVELLSEHLFATSNMVRCLVVVLNNELVGYATFMKQFSTWDANFYIYLDCLFLKEDIRGKGLGTQIMERIRVYAKSENCEIIQWQTPNFNKKAIEFYKNLGAESKTKERFSWNV